MPSESIKTICVIIKDYTQTSECMNERLKNFCESNTICVTIKDIIQASELMIKRLTNPRASTQFA